MHMTNCKLSCIGTMCIVTKHNKYGMILMDRIERKSSLSNYSLGAHSFAFAFHNPTARPITTISRVAPRSRALSSSHLRLYSDSEDKFQPLVPILPTKWDTWTCVQSYSQVKFSKESWNYTQFWLINCFHLCSGSKCCPIWRGFKWFHIGRWLLNNETVNSHCLIDVQFLQMSITLRGEFLEF